MMNYFAVSPANRDAVRDALIQACSDATGTTHCMALLDTLFDHGADDLPAWWVQPVPVYFDYDIEPLAAVGPVLVPLAHHDHDRFCAQLDQLLEHCSGRPMLSFVFVRSNAHELRERWRTCTRAHIDGQAFILRFADTRVLAALPHALQQLHWDVLSHSVQQWWVVDRKGQPLRLPSSSDAAMNLPDRIRLNMQELGALLRAGEPDALIDALQADLPDLLPSEGACALHEKVHEVCDLANRHGVEVFGDKFSLAAFALQSPAFLADARLTTLLSVKAWECGHLAEALAGLERQQ